VKAGRLRHWLTFETKAAEADGSAVLDSDGKLEEDWVPAFQTSPRLPCEVVYLSGRELIAAQAVQSKVNVRIRARARPGFDAVQRARSPAGQIFNVEAVIPDPDSGNRFVTLLASTGVNEG